MKVQKKDEFLPNNSNLSQITCNNVPNRFLNFSESVALGLEPEPSINDFLIKKELGHGSFGRVFEAMHKKTKVDYAIKVIDKSNKNNIEGRPYFKREIEIMYKLRHPNCIRLFGHFEDESNCYFIMEYAPKGNLYNLIMANKPNGLNKKMVINIMKDLIKAIHYLHNMDPPIIHRDIKPENLLLSEKNKIKLTDFGWANYINYENEIRNTFCGTPLYLAPEMIQNFGHGKSVDIWCMGVLLFELLVGNPPFMGGNREILIKNILNVNISWPKYPKKDIDPDAKDLILKILKINPKKRITLEEMIKHPFFVKNNENGDNDFIINNNYKFDHKPFVICRDIPSISDEDEKENEIIPEKKVIFKYKIKSNDNNKYAKYRDITPHNYSKLNLGKYYINKSSDNIILSEDDENNKHYRVNTNVKGAVPRNKLVYNKSALNIFHKPSNNNYNKIKEKNNELKKENDILKLKIEELSLNAVKLKQTNDSLTKKLKQKQKEIDEKNSRISDLENKINSNFKINNNNIIINNNNDINNLNNSRRRLNEFKSKTPEPSPNKFKVRKKYMPLYKKKSIVGNNSFVNDSQNITNSSIESDDIKNNLYNEIRILQIENKNIKEKEKSEVIKLTRQLMEKEKELKRWKNKVKDLENQIKAK